MQLLTLLFQSHKCRELIESRAHLLFINKPLNNMKDPDIKEYTIITEFSKEEKPQFMKRQSRATHVVDYLVGFFWAC